MIRVQIHPDHASISTAVRIFDHWDDDVTQRPARVLRLKPRDGEDVGTWYAEWEEISDFAPVEPTLVLPDEVLRPLLDALARYYCGAEDTRTLRQDLDNERQRADVLIDHLGTIARNLTAASQAVAARPGIEPQPSSMRP